VDLIGLLDWAFKVDRTESDWIGLDRTRSDSTGLNRTGSDWIELDRTGSDWTGLEDWTGLGLDRTGPNQIYCK
jgi:hypothetical protein